MTNKEKLLIAEMLRLASEKFSNHGCNDLEERLADGWTKEDHRLFMKQYLEIENEYPDIDIKNFLHLGDSVLMGHLANKLLREVREKK